MPPHADIIVMTMGHNSDIPVITEIAAHEDPFSYLGVIGSRSKAAIIRKELALAGVAREFIDAIVCPVGDKVGDNTPAEIALGIVTQLMKQRRGG